MRRNPLRFGQSSNVSLLARTGVAAMAAGLLSACAAVPADAPVASAPATPAVKAAQPLPASTQSELPRVAAPSHYTITIQPDMDALTFGASAGIDLTVFEATDAITLNANNLDIKTAALVAEDGTRTDLSIGTITDAQTIAFTAPAAIQPGNYRLETTYTGTINTQPVGLFALDYPDKRTGKEVRGLFTQFEAPDARRFVPSFDEPSYKASYDLSAIVPANLMALSNMPAASETPMDGGLKKVSFETSPIMSSYLLYFGLGDFERITTTTANGTELGIVAPAGSGEQGRFALNGLADIVPYYNEYFGVDYPLPKLDNIAGPGSSQMFGAMENWGAVFTFERILLDDPKVTSASARKYIYDVQAHEVAHQWFGDLVTMGWWNDLWLNEGFASWMSTKATDHFHPDWEMLLGRVSSRESAMSLDGYETTHPIVQQIDNVASMEQAFDAITYSKGEAVISMLEAFAGEDVWRDGLRIYMKQHAYQNTTSADLWSAVEKAGAPGIIGVADDFISKPGVPLVKVNSAVCEGGNTKVSLTQSEFSLDRKDAVAANPQSWRVPLLLRTGASEGQREVLEGSATYTIPGCGPVVVNGGQLGYFRTLYKPEMLDAIIAGYGSLAPIDQYGLLRDNLSLSLAGYQPMGEGLDMLNAVPTDSEGVLATSAVNRWQEYYGLLEDDGYKAKVATIAADDWLPRLQQIGFDPVDGESANQSELRDRLIGALGAMGNPVVVAEAGRRFAALEQDPTALDGPLKETWIGVIARNATQGQWDLLRKLASASNSQVERDLLTVALAENADEAIADKALVLMLSDEVGKSAAGNMLQAVAGNFPDKAWDFAMKNESAVSALVDPTARTAYYSRLAAKGSPEGALERLAQWRTMVPTGDQNLVDRDISRVKNRLASQPRQRAGLREWLDANG